MSTFTLYPAIDLRGGRVVRLAQGDPNRETAYADVPLQVARRWQVAGADWLHVVNLDGALGEAGAENLRALGTILSLGVQVQFGGGLRDMVGITHVLSAGVARVVLGTAAVEDPALLAAALAEFGPERIALGLDARDGFVRVRGWQKASALRAAELAQRWAAAGGKWLIFTDVARDGMSQGVNVEATAALARETGLHVIASGGVHTLEDVYTVRRAGLNGLIIGRALYEGHIDLAEALLAATEDARRTT